MISDLKKFLVVLVILSRGVTAEYKMECSQITWNFVQYGGLCERGCGCSEGAISCEPDCLRRGNCEQEASNCADKTKGDCKCVEVKPSTEPPTTDAPTKMATEPPTSEAPTTEPPTSEDPAKAPTKAPTDAPDEKQTPAPPTTSKPDEKQTPAPPTTSTQTPTDALTKAPTDAPAGAWPKYPGRNCYWDNHGAEEVDYPWGKAVAKAKTLHACQAACVEAADFGCHGVLFQVATGNCYRKKDIVVEKCVRDESVDLYVRPSATVFVDRLE